MNSTILKFFKFNALVVAFFLINTLFALGFKIVFDTEHPSWYWGILGMMSATQAMVFDSTREIKEALNGVQKRTKCKPEAKD